MTDIGFLKPDSFLQAHLIQEITDKKDRPKDLRAVLGMFFPN